MGRRPTESGLMHQRFAREYGCKVRQARNHHAKNTPQWQAFVAGELLPGARAVKAREADMPERMNDLEKAAWLKEQAWSHCRDLDRLMGDAVARQSPADVVQSFARACQLAQRRWEDAKKHEEALKREAGLYVPFERVLGVGDAIVPLCDMFRQLKGNIAARLQPEARLEFYRAFEEAMPAWNACVQRVGEHIRGLVPAL